MGQSVASIVGCIYHASNDMVPTSSSRKKKAASQSAHSKSPSEFHIVERAINDLLKKFKEYCRYIYLHRADYTSNDIIRVDNDFHGKQRKDNCQQRDFMLYNEISTLDGTRISEEQVKQLQMYKAASSTLHTLFYLKHWELAHDKRLKDLFDHRFMKLEDFSQIAEDFAAIKMDNTINKQCRNLKACNRPNLYKAPVERFSKLVLNYLYHDLLPWGKVVDLFIFHALNTSVAQGKMLLQEAESSYQAACQAIASICNTGHIQAIETCCRAKLQSVMKCHANKDSCTPIKIFKEIKQCILQPIEEMYSSLTLLP
ncbi:MAG: hypothetical protein NMK33_02735 [Candidatus Cardinium sp.]|uniref:hypothetical protein n=1 Tax=Cardinium endosymbiont of Dermatophagoides farinae TaxID=2597823 RepID=UPI00118447C9|nr:hypothetical protein [Cardinium endosymbiont of Dermatophagoides farinae]TSJ81389.1 hypothetical protein FPG78_05410 [Cardinium endosymbiont of Dermatophagoides farinae]UWW97454.1 MAG: hypothetical protein NMK33_02735 [Candidatus Cardinium sp.]